MAGGHAHAARKGKASNPMTPKQLRDLSEDERELRIRQKGEE